MAKAKRKTALDTQHPAIAQYYGTLAEYHDQRVRHEGAVSTAFENLLTTLAKQRGWVFIPLLAVVGKRIVPDGTIRDGNGLPRAYWEAKDTNDDLDAEIVEKISKPLNNVIFEDTREAVLYQSGEQIKRYNLSDPGRLVELLTCFFSYVEPDIEGFEAAVEEFKDRVPELAKGLLKKIREAQKDNAKFVSAFGDFFDLCRSAIDPKIQKRDVEEMLVQHLLTERLFRTIFDNPEFSQRNVIANEVDKVIATLIGKSFSSVVYLKSLDSFYLAIENAARTLPDSSDRQYFLDTVYERFFRGYSTRLADTHGIVYTPQPIVDFMSASVVHVWYSVTHAEELLETATALIRAGKIRYWGISNAPAWYVATLATLAAVRGAPGPIAMQYFYSLVERSVEDEHVPLREEFGMSIVPWSPLAFGFLTGKYDRAAVEAAPARASGLPRDAGDEQSQGPANDKRLDGANPFGDSLFTPKNWTIVDELKRVAQKMGESPARVALAWLCGRPGVTSTIVGVSRTEHLTANACALEVVLSEKHRAALDEVSAPSNPRMLYALFTSPVRRQAVFGGA